MVREFAGSQPYVYNALASRIAGNAAPLSPDPKFKGAIVVKVIWEPAEYVRAPHHPNIPAFPTGSLAASGWPQNLQPGSGGNLPALSSWLPTSNTSAQIDFSSSDTTCAGEYANGVYPSSCFTMLDMSKHPSYVQQVQSLIDASTDAQNIQISHLVLVGVNVMQFDPILYPNWLWSSFWWSKQRGVATFKDKPNWSHFQGCAVHQPRTENQFKQDQVCFNPYLEGVASQPGNGIYSNCLTCHQHAGFQTAQPGADPKTLPSQAVNGSCIGLLDKNGAPPSTCGITPQAFDAKSLRTHFLWSVADAVSPQTPPSSPSPQH
jgi:hypothetical protein